MQKGIISGNCAKLSLAGCSAKVKLNINVFISINISGLPLIDQITILIIHFHSFNNWLTEFQTANEVQSMHFDYFIFLWPKGIITVMASFTHNSCEQKKAQIQAAFLQWSVIIHQWSGVLLYTAWEKTFRSHLRQHGRAA